MSYLKIIYCGLFLNCYSQMLFAQVANQPVRKQSFRITGSTGTSASFYSSNESVQSRPSFAWNIYGNMMARYNKFSFPFSYVINQYNGSHMPPYVQIGISPTYQWARLLLGYRTTRFSPLTFEGQSFRGVGLELNPKHFRFSTFYGKLNKAVNEDTSRGQFKVPQFSRTGYGIKIGVGNTRKYLDVIYFHAKDDSSSAAILSNNAKSNVRAQENAVFGSSFRLPFSKKITWNGDAAISGLAQDISNNKTIPDSVHPSLNRFVNHFIKTNTAIEARYAVQSALSYYSPVYNTNFTYRRVEPQFKSLGTPYMINDVELFSWFNNLAIAKGKFNINSSLSSQHNNLDASLPVELVTLVGIMNMNATISQHFNINFNYSGYNLEQSHNDTLLVKDSALLNQRIAQYSISPSYNITQGNNLHYLSASVNLQTLKDRNATTAAQVNSNNLSTSLNYMLAFINKPLNFSITYLYSQYKQQESKFNSNGVTLGSSVQLLKNRNLNMQGSVGYFINSYNSNAAQKNITYSFNTGYRNRHHSFNAYINYIYTPSNPINDIIKSTVFQAVATNNLAGGVSYTYSF